MVDRDTNQVQQSRGRAMQIPGLISDSSREGYAIRVRQQPLVAIACGFGEIEHRIVDPPPIVQLTLTNPSLTHEQITRKLKSPFSVTHCTLLHATKDEDKTTMPGVTDRRPQRRLMGTLVVSPFVGRDENGEEGCFFCFPDLSCRTHGSYRLKFQLVILDSNKFQSGSSFPILSTTVSEPFQVFDAKEFPGVQASTSLTKKLKEQGCCVPIKKANNKNTAAREATLETTIILKDMEWEHPEDGDPDFTKTRVEAGTSNTNWDFAHRGSRTYPQDENHEVEYARAEIPLTLQQESNNIVRVPYVHAINQRNELDGSSIVKQDSGYASGAFTRSLPPHVSSRNKERTEIGNPQNGSELECISEGNYVSISRQITSNDLDFDDAGMTSDSPGVNPYLPVQNVGWTPSIGGASLVRSEDYDSAFGGLLRIFIEDPTLKPLFQVIVSGFGHETIREDAQKGLGELFRGYCVLMRDRPLQRGQTLAVQFLRRRIDGLVKLIFFKLGHAENDDTEHSPERHEMSSQERSELLFDAIQRWKDNLLGERTFETPTQDNKNMNDNVEDETAEILKQFEDLKSFFVDNAIMKDFRVAVRDFVDRKPLIDWERKVNQVIMKKRGDREESSSNLIRETHKTSQPEEVNDDSNKQTALGEIIKINRSAAKKLEQLQNVEKIDGGFRVSWSCCCNEHFSAELEGATREEALEVFQILNWDVEKDGPKKPRPQPDWIRNLLWVFWPSAIEKGNDQDIFATILNKFNLQNFLTQSKTLKNSLPRFNSDENVAFASRTSVQQTIESTSTKELKTTGGRNFGILSLHTNTTTGNNPMRIGDHNIGGVVQLGESSNSKTGERPRHKLMKTQTLNELQSRGCSLGEAEGKMVAARFQYICICSGRLDNWRLSHAEIQQTSKDPFRIYPCITNIDILEKRLPHEPRDELLDAPETKEPTETTSLLKNKGKQRAELSAAEGSVVARQSDEVWWQICSPAHWDFSTKELIPESKLKYYKATYLNPGYLRHNILNGHFKPSACNMAKGFPRKLIEPLQCAEDEYTGRFGWGIVVTTEWAWEPLLVLMVAAAIPAYIAEGLMCWKLACTASVGVSVGMAIWTTIMAVPMIISLLGKQRGAVR